MNNFIKIILEDLVMDISKLDKTYVKIEEHYYFLFKYLNIFNNNEYIYTSQTYQISR